MAIYALGDIEPETHPDADVHPEAVVIGAVALGAGSSVWPTAVLRGGNGTILVGERTSIQDGTVVHTTEIQHTIIGSDCTVGHNVHIEAAVIADHCLIASGAVVLNGSQIDEGAVVGAGAVISPNFHLPARRMALGVPARIREGYEVPDRVAAGAAQAYVQIAKRHRAELRRLS
ncbi:MAG: gamma carbonic anhydrase family protein [Actinomycetota bacterium]|nr:gamma carbonic anhydrase family protein [Actinomycetota bacterium]